VGKVELKIYVPIFLLEGALLEASCAAASIALAFVKVSMTKVGVAIAPIDNLTLSWQ
jgi:hypothetical protein